MRLLVTGAGGFLGASVVRAARNRGHHVTALLRSTRPDAAQTAAGSAPPVVQITGDLRDENVAAKALANVECVVHCAASLTGGAAEQQRDTVDATRSLLNAIESSGVDRIVGISSFAVYNVGKLKDGATLDESSPLHSGGPLDEPYVSAKLEQENLIREASQKGSLQHTILRPGLIFGPGRTWFHELGLQLSASRWLILAPDSILPVTFVENCAEAVVLSAQCTAAATTLNIVDDELPSRGEYAAFLASRSSPTPKMSTVSWEFLNRVARFATGLNRRLSGGRLPLPGLLQSDALQARSKPLEYTNRAARETLAWSPRYGWKRALENSLSTGD